MGAFGFSCAVASLSRVGGGSRRRRRSRDEEAGDASETALPCVAAEEGRNERSGAVPSPSGVAGDDGQAKAGADGRPTGRTRTAARGGRSGRARRWQLRACGCGVQEKKIVRLLLPVDWAEKFPPSRPVRTRMRAGVKGKMAPGRAFGPKRTRP
uniref:Uncharacterized protein n=1 Tax=Oryza brachyantha TaxID=4533 RepID=J3MHE6_ORYBR